MYNYNLNVKLLGYEFARYDYESQIPERPGIYVVRDFFERVIDVGESDGLASRIQFHDRRQCRDRKRMGPIHYLVIFAECTTYEVRLAVEAILRSQLNPTCGIR